MVSCGMTRTPPEDRQREDIPGQGKGLSRELRCDDASPLGACMSGPRGTFRQKNSSLEAHFFQHLSFIIALPLQALGGKASRRQAPGCGTRPVGPISL